MHAVGIFVDHSPAEINAICRLCKLQTAQLHSDHYSPEQARSITEAKVIKVFRPEEDFSVDEVLEFARKSGTTSFLFDAYRPGMPGGTGQRIKASLASRIISQLKKEAGSSCYAILAGGLNETNVDDAIRSVHPYGVDTASGVESAPGIKDPGKIKAFIQAIRDSED